MYSSCCIWQYDSVDEFQQKTHQEAQKAPNKLASFTYSIAISAR